MSDIINELLLVEDKLIFKIHLKQPRFKYSAYGTFIKHKESKKQEISK